MPLVPSFDERVRRVNVRGSGVIRLEDVLTLVGTARADAGHRMWSMLVDATGATTDMTDADVDRLVAAVHHTVHTHGERAHVAIVADDGELYGHMLAYEARCAALGVRVIRVFRQPADAANWLDIVAASRNLS
jgi:hypothetical protein